MSETLDRRQFTLQSALAMLGGVVITISGCGGGSSSPSTPSQNPPPTGGGSGDRVGNVSANHGHNAVITSAQVTAGGALTLDIRGSATHPHTVVLTAAEVASIGSGQRVSKTSSSEDAHDHTVTFN